MVSVVAGACTPAIATRGQVEDLLLDFARGRVSGTPPERGAADYVHVQNITAGGVERTAIFVHPPAIVSFDVRLLPGARFEALAGIDDRAIEKGSDGATFHVRAIRQGKVEKSVSLDLDPGTAGGRGWRPVGVDLADLGGRHATIELSTEAGKSSSYDWVGFAAPRIVSRGEPVRARRPEDGSIVLVSLDTVRVDRLGAYGEPLPLTPRIDALTRKLAIFPDAVSPSHWTLPAHMSLFASLPADVHGADVHRGIPEGLPLLTTELRRAGYATAGFAADVGWLRPEYGFGRGFDLYLPTSEDARVRSERAREHLERLDGRRCFLFVHFFDAHSDFGSIPYEASAESMRAFAPGAPTFPPCAGERCASKVLWDMNAAGQRYAAGDEATMRAMYGAGLHDLDHEVGRLRAELRETGILDHALFAIFSDHGEEIGDHGKYLHDQGYAETTRVLLGVGVPGRGAGLRGGMASLVDVAPTLLAGAGLRVPSSWVGVDLDAFVPSEAYTATEFGETLLRTDRTTMRRTKAGALVAYDRAVDPGETSPLAVEPGDSLASRLEEQRKAHCVTAQGLGARPSVELDDEERRRNLAFGYNDPGRPVAAMPPCD